MDYKIIYDLIKEMREDLSEHKKEQTEQGKCLSEIRTDLKYHIKRTDMLEDLHKDNLERINQNKERIEKMEMPEKARNYMLGSWKIWSGAIIAAITIGSKIAGLW